MTQSLLRRAKVACPHEQSNQILVIRSDKNISKRAVFKSDFVTIKAVCCIDIIVKGARN